MDVKRFPIWAALTTFAGWALALSWRSMIWPCQCNLFSRIASCLDSRPWPIFWSHPFFSLLHAQFHISLDKKGYLWPRVAQRRTRCWEGIWRRFSLLFSLSSRGTSTLPIFRQTPLNEDELTTFMATIFLLKCFKMVSVEFRKLFAAGHVVDVKIAIFDLCKSFPC